MNSQAAKNQRDVKRSVEEQFGQVAANYSASPVHAAGAELARMVDLAELAGSECILDAGCGPGHTAFTFAPNVRQVIAVDLAAAMLEQGHRLATERGIANIDFRRADVEALPFAGAAFDVIATRYSAHHWPNPQAALAEFHRVLRPDAGRLLLADVISFSEPVIDTHLQTVELLRDPSHVRDHTTEQWLATMAAAGFTAEVAYTWDLRLDFTSWVGRMATPPSVVAMIRDILTAAPAEVKSALRIEPDCSFTLRCALISAAFR
ncbi:MAG: methyltransferase domain-containing protein [Chloroflexota bacterium]|nr:methyltransferase domain-containing protein [Chloroflexota bacterium]